MGEVSRRTVLRLAGLGVTAGTLALLTREDGPQRVAFSAPSERSDIQHDVSRFLAPAQAIDGTLFRFGPRYTLFLTYALRRTPTRADRRALDEALAAVESAYRPAASGIFATVAYGMPYFGRLPGGLVREHVPRLLSDPARPAFEEAVAAPTDTLRKKRFNVPLRIESNDLLVTLRSDDVEVLADVGAWLGGSGELAGRRTASPPFGGLLERTSSRLMFLERGLPRKLAVSASLPYAARVNPDSPMWMGFSDQQADGSGPPEITTFLGSPAAKLTDAAAGDYFDLGAVQHLSHTILDLDQFYLGEGGSRGDSETYFVRAQYMFRATPPPAPGHGDQVTDGGGPAFLPNEFLGTGDAERGARGEGTPDGVRRIGHVAAFQRSSRAADGTPLHIRVDGPGFDALDVPGGHRAPKLHFSILVPSAEAFARMRRDGAAVDLAKRHRVADADNGLERFLTTTRRQNFLVPPRRHRAFPLTELV